MAQHGARKPLTAQRCEGEAGARPREELLGSRPGCASPPRCAPPPWCAPPPRCTPPSWRTLPSGYILPSWRTLHPGCAPLAPSLAASEYPDSGPPSHHRHRHRCAHKAKPAGFAALLAGCEQTWDKLPRPRHSETAARKWGKVRLCLAELVLDADVWTLPQHSESALRVYAGQSRVPL